VISEHFGDPFVEQRTFSAGDAMVDVSDREIVQVTGPDRLTWLHSIISQDVQNLSPHHTVEGLVLDPHGHIEQAFLLTDDGATTWLMVESGFGESLAFWLSSMKFRMQVEISFEPDAWTILVGIEPLGATLQTQLDSAGSPEAVFADPWPRVGEGSIGYASEPHPGADWSVKYLVYPAEKNPALSAVPRSGSLTLQALSIAAGRPSRQDTDVKALPHELDWLRSAVHLNKGCYRGQETVAKVHNLGHPPRRLTLLHLDGSESMLPLTGDQVMNGEAEVGVITRAAWHYELGPIALALLKRNTDPEATLVVNSGEGSIAAAQEILVPPDAGAARRVPRMPRLGARASE
jgi:folate-binding protein YgfZ